MLQTICTITIPQPYTFIPGAIFIAAASWSTVSGILGLKKESEETTRIVGRTTAYLDFGDKSHVGKLPGSLAFPTGSVPERKPPKLAIMLIGSRCQSKLGAVQPEFKEMGEVFAGMLHELRNAPPEEDVGFLNAEAYMHSGDSTNNSNMVRIPTLLTLGRRLTPWKVCLYFRTYAHMIKFAHAKGGAHWDSWNKFRDLQRDKAKLGTEIGLWHEAYEISNAESIYINMPSACVACFPNSILTTMNFYRIGSRGHVGSRSHSKR